MHPQMTLTYFMIMSQVEIDDIIMQVPGRLPPPTHLPITNLGGVILTHSRGPLFRTIPLSGFDCVS